METRIWTCDCGCGEKANKDHEKNGWLILSQPIKAKGSHLKLKREFHFRWHDCFVAWAEKTKPIIQGLEKSARDAPFGEVRGDYVNKEIPDIYV